MSFFYSYFLLYFSRKNHIGRLKIYNLLNFIFKEIAKCLRLLFSIGFRFPLRFQMWYRSYGEQKRHSSPSADLIRLVGWLGWAGIGMKQFSLCFFHNYNKHETVFSLLLHLLEIARNIQIPCNCMWFISLKFIVYVQALFLKLFFCFSWTKTEIL